MKRFLGFLTALAMLVSVLAGCGGISVQETVQKPGENAGPAAVEKATEAFATESVMSAAELGESAYKSLCEAYEQTDQLAHDLHNAWYVGAYEKKRANGKLAEYIAAKITYLSKEELLAGIARTIAWEVDGKKWADLTDEERTSYIEFADSEFYIKEEYFQFICMSSILHAYYLSGGIEEIKDRLSEAKTQLKSLNEQYPDYGNYAALKTLYVTVDSYFDLCYSDGDGGAGISFNQFKELRGTYVKEAQACMSELEFDFVD